MTMASFGVGAKAYDNDFFDYISVGSQRSAALAIPVVLDYYRPASLLDVGCGRGAWLCEWQSCGVTHYLGIDGYYVDRRNLLIPSDRFEMRDLTNGFNVGRTFDLVTSLEVGEHINPSASSIFVDNLCAHSDAILFSAAVPGQGGTGHINEQPYEFWREHFCQRGYRLFDFMRPALAGQRAIEPWYRYNMLLFARRGAVDRLKPKARACEIRFDDPVPDYSPLFWRLRNTIIRRLPSPLSERLVELKHIVVRCRHG